MKDKNISKCKDESYNNSKDFTKFSSRDFGCYDVKGSPLLTFKTMEMAKHHKVKKHKSCKRPNWNFSATTLVSKDLFRLGMIVHHMLFPFVKDLALLSKM